MTLSRLNILAGLRISIWEGVWATVFVVLTTGAFQTGFVQNRLGAGPFELGLMAGLPAAVNLLQIPASLYVERRGERRRFVGISALIGRLLWLPILLIPFVLPRSLQLPAFLLLLTLSSIFLTISVPAWTSWMSDLVPAESRGEYFARRNQLAGLVAMLVPLPAGAFLDQAVKYGRFDPRLGFATLFGIACLAAVAAFFLILRQPEPPMTVPEGPRPNPLRSLGTPFADSQFRAFMTFAAVTVFGQGMAGQFFISWQIGRQELSQPYLVAQLLGAVASAGGLLTTPLWGYLADKYGSRPVLMISTALTILSPLFWILTEPEAFWLNILIIGVLNLIAGTAWAGVGLAQFNLLLSLPEPAARATYVAVFSAVTGVLGAVAPILGGVLMTLLQPVIFELGPLTINNYKLLFFGTALIRVICIYLLSRLPVGDSHPTRYVVTQLVASRSLASYLTARKLARPTTESERRRTVEELTTLRSPLAVEELSRALEDVSSEVREQAVEALAGKLFDPAAGLGELAADALGRIGKPEAAAYLVAAARGPDAGVRLAAIKALGEVTDPALTPEAIPTLLQALTPHHPTQGEAACLALVSLAARLSREQAGQALTSLLPLLESGAENGVERGLRFAAARALAALAECLEPEAAEAGYLALRRLLTAEEDPAVLARESVAMERLGRKAGHSPVEIAGLLLPLLEQIPTSGLSYKQMLSALADLALPRGAFYPYLSLTEMERDQTFSRLVEELGDRLRKRRSRPGAQPGVGFEPAALLEAFSAGDFARFHGLLAVAPLEGENQDIRSWLRQGLARRAAEVRTGPEEGLLALLLVLSPRNSERTSFPK